MKSALAPELADVKRAARSYLLIATGFSLAINLLYLASPIYMLQVYNRVVTSGSETTLLLLTVILLVAFAALSALDLVRSRILGRLSIRLERMLAPRLFALSFQASETSGSQVLREFEMLRNFASSGSVSALLDLPWVPIYIVAAFLLHPLIGAFTVAGCVLLIGLAIANEYALANLTRRANEASARGHGFAEMSLRNRDVVRAMGLIEGVTQRWMQDRSRSLASQTRANERAGAIGALIRFVRLSMQSLVLGLGALLAIQRVVSPGAMFAATFLLGRALQPIEQIVGSWRQIVAARAAYSRLRDLLTANPIGADRLVLPEPVGHLQVEGVHYAVPGTNRFVLRGISLEVRPGEGLGVVGPSGAGKSTLMRLLVGVLRPSAGTIRLDGADLQAWPTGQLGRAIGYLPQDVELFADTVAANISRFSEGADAQVVEAAKLAGVHEMILRLPQGYNTPVGEGGAALSGGLRQRLGLARAVFGSPRLVVLDEPSSNLDAEGDAALTACVNRLKQGGASVVIVSHRPSTLAGVDRIALIKDGGLQALGPRDDVASQLAPARKARQATVELEGRE